MNTRDLTVKLAVEAAGLIVRPGDKLVLRVADRISYAETDELKARLAEMLPGVEPVIIVGFDQMAVYRPSEERCGDRTSIDPRYVCRLDAGHPGRHEDGVYTWRGAP